MMSVIGKKGFTLIEVMAAVVILSLGTMMIQEGLLRNVALSNQYSNRLKAEIWISEKIASVKEPLLYSDFPELETRSGSFEDDGEIFHWDIATSDASSGKELYEIKINIRWDEGNRTLGIHRMVYAEKPSIFGSAV